jgi:demethylmenaquinone methyltransferase/2-methoxy-6-polyprenyl-1,4-benzoquinol methylase
LVDVVKDRAPNEVVASSAEQTAANFSQGDASTEVNGNQVDSNQGDGNQVDGQQVRAMFDRIAGVYDYMNTVMTAGLHHKWRERTADLACLKPGDSALDVATGTGDLALALARRVGVNGEVVGSDFSEQMLSRARAKKVSVGNIRWELGNALNLPYPDCSFNAATVGFGARNFADLERGISELARVVRPGGRVVILELTRPQKQPLAAFFSLWFDRLVPFLGRFAGDSAAYTYLPQSVRRFPNPDELAAKLAANGLSDVSWLITGGGAVAIHVGTVAQLANR